MKTFLKSVFSRFSSHINDLERDSIVETVEGEVAFVPKLALALQWHYEYSVGILYASVRVFFSCDFGVPLDSQVPRNGSTGRYNCAVESMISLSEVV